MSDELDIRLFVPFLRHRLNGPVYVSFIALAELFGAALFVVFALRILYLIRQMMIAELQELRDRKLNELMESIAELEREAKLKKEKKKRKGTATKMDDDSEMDEIKEIEGNPSNGIEEKTND